MMRRFMHNTKCCVEFFMMVALANKLTFLYTIFLPATLLLARSDSTAKEGLFTVYVPCVSYTLFMYGINTAVELGYLREQGYLKQYQSLVGGVGVFALSKGLVGWIHMQLSLVVITLIFSLLYHVPVLALFFLVALYATCLFIPIFFVHLFLAALPIRSGSLTVVVNAVVMLSFALSLMDIYFQLPWFKHALFALPLYYSQSTLIWLLNHQLGQFLTLKAWLPALAYVMIGLVTYKKIRVLPVEHQ